MDYSKDWRAYNVKNENLLIKNSDGYLAIENNLDNLDFYILYDNKALKLLNILFIILSTIFSLVIFYHTFYIKEKY